MLSKVQRLKLELLTHGLTVSQVAQEKLSQQGQQPLTLAEYATTSGVSLRIGDDVWVNAPIREFNSNFVENPAAVLELDGGTYTVRTPEQVVPAHPLPVPAYHGKLNSSEEPYTSYAATHTDRVRISPIQGCAIVCTFCDLPYNLRYRRKRIDGLIEAVQVALEDEQLPARHVLISGGTPKPEDYEHENTVYRAVAEAFPSVSVDVMMAPMPGLLDPVFLFDIGIHGLAINIEIYSDEVARKVIPLKKRVGIQNYLDFIEEAVEIFGPGRVRSLILVGLEPIESTLEGVRELAARGCDPILSPLRPDPATPLREHPTPSVEDLERAYLESLEIVSEYPEVKLGPRCIPCQHNTLTFPDGSGAYSHH